MVSDIREILKKLDITDKRGRYDNHFYVISLDNSDEYARMYTKLDKNAVNTEYPEFEKNTNDSTVKITNYFELELNNYTYDIYLMADFDKDSYYIKISERPEDDLRL